MDGYIFNDMEPGQEGAVSRIVRKVFSGSAALDHTDEGINNFMKMVRAGEIRKSVDSGRYFILCCFRGKILAGMISVKDHHHISMLFVRERYQGLGIATALFDMAVKRCREEDPGLDKLSVHSSPGATGFYRELGFVEKGGSTERDGIIFVPMEMSPVIDIKYSVMDMDDYEEAYTLWADTPGIGMNQADSAANIEKFLARNKGFSFICRINGAVAGTILCGHDGRRGYIYHACVRSEHRGKGIGKTLVGKSLRRLGETGISRCHIFVFADNKAGSAFWDSTGWVKRNDIFVYTKNL